MSCPVPHVPCMTRTLQSFVRTNATPYHARYRNPNSGRSFPLKDRGRLASNRLTIKCSCMISILIYQSHKDPFRYQHKFCAALGPVYMYTVVANARANQLHFYQPCPLSDDFICFQTRDFVCTIPELSQHLARGNQWM